MLGVLMHAANAALIITLFNVICIEHRAVRGSSSVEDSMKYGLAYTGPRFVTEPRNGLTFTNTEGGLLHCSGTGYPSPDVNWVYDSGESMPDMPALRKTLRNGSLWLLPFPPAEYRHDVHSTSVRCRLSNTVGEIVSAAIAVKAELEQEYSESTELIDSFPGCTAVLECDLPENVKDDVQVESWYILPQRERVSYNTQNSKYSLLPNGNLLVHNLSPADEEFSYYCQTLGNFTSETAVSTPQKITMSHSIYPIIPPSIMGESRIVYGTVGGDHKLFCQRQGCPEMDYRWIRVIDGKTVPIISDTVQPLGPILAFNNLHVSDDGIYRCKVDNRFGKYETDIRLVVIAPVHASITPYLLVVPHGRPAELTCNIITEMNRRMIEIVWYKDGKMIPKEGEVPDKLIISAVKRKDEGMYQCVARGLTGELATAASQLRLDDKKPGIFEAFAERIMHPGPTLILECFASGVPLPYFRWEADGFPLANASRIEISDNIVANNESIKSMLNITRTSGGDSANYTCKAINRAGQAGHTNRINIYGPPQIRPMSNQTSVVGKQFRLKCPVGGYPIDKITWEQDGQELPINIRQTVMSDGTLIVSPVQKLDIGTYTCKAVHSGMTASENMEMDVIEPPRWEVEPQIDTQVLVGEMKQLTCKIYSIPPAQITWKKAIGGKSTGRYENIVKPDTFFKNGTLVIKQATENSSGIYLCHGTNGIGSGISRLITLRVNSPPTAVVLNIGFVAVQVGGVAKLQCSANGTFPLTARWTKENDNDGLRDDARYNITDKFSPTGLTSMLVISEVESSDSSHYICEIRNLYGNTSAILFLFVLQEPRPSSPYNVRIVKNNKTSVTVMWEHQKRDTGSKDSVLYIVEYTDSFSKREAKYVADDNLKKVTINGLLPENIYTICVKASNRGGESPPSASLKVNTYTDLSTIPSTPPWTLDGHAPSTQSIEIIQEGNELNDYLLHADPLIWMNLTLAKVSVNFQCLVNREENITSTRKQEDSNNFCVISSDGETNMLANLLTISGLNTASTGSSKADWSKASIHKPTINKKPSMCGTTYEGKMTSHNTVGEILPIQLNVFIGIGGLSDGPPQLEFIKQKEGSTFLDFNRWPNEPTCPVINLMFKYTLQTLLNWTQFSFATGPTMELYDLEELSPYEVLVLAHNGAGTAIHNYKFETLKNYKQETSTTVHNQSIFKKICGIKTPSWCLIRYLVIFFGISATAVLVFYICKLCVAKIIEPDRGEEVLEMKEYTYQNFQSTNQRNILSGGLIGDVIVPCHTFPTPAQRSQRNHTDTSLSSQHNIPIFNHKNLITHEPYIPQIANAHLPRFNHQHRFPQTLERRIPPFQHKHGFPQISQVTQHRILQGFRNHPVPQFIHESHLPVVTHEQHHLQIHRPHDSLATPYFPRVSQVHRSMPMITHEYHIPMVTHERYIPQAQTEHDRTPYDSPAISCENLPQRHLVQMHSNRFETRLSMQELSTSDSNQPNSSQPESSPQLPIPLNLTHRINRLTANISSSDSTSTDQPPPPRRPPPRRLYKRSTALSGIQIRSEEDVCSGTSNKIRCRRHQSRSSRDPRDDSRNCFRVSPVGGPRDFFRDGPRGGPRFWRPAGERSNSCHSGDYSIDV